MAAARSLFSALSTSALKLLRTLRPSCDVAVMSIFHLPLILTSSETGISLFGRFFSSSLSKAASILRYSRTPSLRPSTDLHIIVRPSQTSPRNPTTEEPFTKAKPSPLCSSTPPLTGLRNISIPAFPRRSLATVPMNEPRFVGASMDDHSPRFPSRKSSV